MDELIHIIQNINPYVDFDEKTLLLGEDIIDSMGVIYLVSEIEDKFRLKIPQTMVTLANFRTIEDIMQMIQRLEEESSYKRSSLN